MESEELRRLAVALRARLYFHRQCGITRYPFVAAPQVLLRSAQPQAVPAMSRASGKNVNAPQTQGAAPVSNLAQIHKALQACTRCPIGSDSPERISGVGPAEANFMVVGDYILPREAQLHYETPADTDTMGATALCFGTDEDVLFWKMMQAIQLGPQTVYVTNVLKCRPGPGEEPAAAWLRQCRLHLIDEIKSVQPRLICAMGEMAAAALLGGSEPVARMRGRVHSLKTGGEGMTHYPVMVTYHPRLLLRLTDMKGAAWQDLQQIQKLLRQGGPIRPE